MALRLAVFLLFATVCSLAAGEPSAAPKRLTARIGGFFGATYAVELHEGKVTYSVSAGAGKEPKRSTITPTEAQWREFRKALDELHVWKWSDSYSNHNVADGTQWLLDVAFEDHALKTTGSNCYPDGAGKPNNDPETTKAFERYLEAVRKLIGGRDFE